MLTGFLGSGKTTFVNYLLHADHGLRLAIIENEFGEVGVDDGLVHLQSTETVIEMMNGCICCTVRDDLIVALKQLVKERRHQFDAIIIETTGLADPAPVAQSFFMDDEMKKLFLLDAIVTFVDCQHTLQHLDESKPEGVENEAVEQVAFADVLVLNKTDLVSADTLSALKDRLRSINATAPMHESTFSVVPTSAVLNVRAFNLDRTIEMDAAFLDADQEHMHDNTVSSVGVCIEGEFDPELFKNWIDELLATRGQDIFRCKGILSICGSNDRYVFQGVHMLLTMGGGDLPKWGPEEKRLNKMCFIGRNLDRKAIIDGLSKSLFNGKYPEPGVPPKTTLRFAVGAKVLVNLSGWVQGTIAAQWYREPLWETGKFVSYQIELPDGGGMVWAPKDTNKFVRSVKG